jgi:hypothetical protein
MLRVLRQLKSKDGAGGAGCRTVPCRAVPGHAARRSAWRCVPHNCREFKPDRIRRFRQRQSQKHQDGLDPSSSRSITYHSTNCAILPLWKFVVLTQLSLYYTVYIILYYTILYYFILYYTILYYFILYYTILFYTILYYTILYYIILYYTILYYTILYYTIQYYTILYYTILYYTILYYIIL